MSGAGWAPRQRLTPNVDDTSWNATRDLARAALTRDREALKHSVDAALSLTRTRRMGVLYMLRIGLWCAMTSVIGAPLEEESAWSLADRIFKQVSMTLTPPEERLASILSQAAHTSWQDYSTPASEFMLMAAVALAELMRIAPAPGNDLDEILDLSAKHWAASQPQVVEQEWLDRLRS